jgi:nucleoredoxin
MNTLFSDTGLVDHQKNQIEPDILSSKKVIGLYFSASWCSPCRAFTPLLAEAYKGITAGGKSFEIVFISSDRDQAEFDTYFSDMPWISLPFTCRDIAANVAKSFKVSSIPLLVLLNGEDGTVITKDGKAAITEDPSLSAYFV